MVRNAARGNVDGIDTVPSVMRAKLTRIRLTTDAKWGMSYMESRSMHMLDESIQVAQGQHHVVYH